MTLNYRDGSMVDFYCPACGTDSPLDHPISYLAPDSEYDITCPKCQKGKMAAKRSKRGKIFYGCDQYPACDMATWDKPINEFCPTCKSILVETKAGKIKCSNKECDFKK